MFRPLTFFFLFSVLQMQTASSMEQQEGSTRCKNFAKKSFDIARKTAAWGCLATSVVFNGAFLGYHYFKNYEPEFFAELNGPCNMIAIASLVTMDPSSALLLEPLNQHCATRANPLKWMGLKFACAGLALRPQSRFMRLNTLASIAISSLIR